MEALWLVEIYEYYFFRFSWTMRVLVVGVVVVRRHYYRHKTEIPSLVRTQNVIILIACTRFKVMLLS